VICVESRKVVGTPEQGKSAEEEKPIGAGKTVDLVASKSRRKIAIEIETGKSDAV